MAEEPATAVQGMDEPDVDFPELPVAAAQEQDASGGFEWPAEPAVASQADAPDWLDQLQPQQEEEPEAAPATQGEPLFSWLDIGAGDQSAAPNTEADMPDWLRAVSAEAEQAVEPASAVDQIDWLSDISSTPEAEAEPVEADAYAEAQPLFAEAAMEPEAEAAPIPARAESDWLDSEFELPQEPTAVESVVAEHTPAENAPDWLNAMVPGVDLDYAPAEEEVVEPTEEATQQASPTQEFDWLIEVVDEETQPAAKTAPAPEPVAEAIPESQPKFSFSKLPAWLRRGGDATTR